MVCMVSTNGISGSWARNRWNLLVDSVGLDKRIVIVGIVSGFTKYGNTLGSWARNRWNFH